MRFYDIDSGRIMIDGVDTATVSRRSLRARIGMVLQDTWLFGGTIAENIGYGRPDASEDEILEAARAAYVDRFVHTLPDGYDTWVSDDGGSISAGEKQLITIARAFLAQPQLLILDEATSSVDTRTELLIQQAMAELRRDRTSFIIAHRLSTIRDADQILVMADGRIVEQGSHDELLARHGAYWEMARLVGCSVAGGTEHADPRGRALGAQVVDLGHRVAQLCQPLLGVLADEFDRPRQRIRAGPGHTGVDQGVEHLALGLLEPGHHRYGDMGEQHPLVAPAGGDTRPQDTLRPKRSSASSAIRIRSERVSSRNFDTRPETRALVLFSGRAGQSADDGDLFAVDHDRGSPSNQASGSRPANHRRRRRRRVVGGCG